MRWHKLVYITFAVVAVGVTAASHAQERFDYRVRDDMFRAFGGNEAAFKNAMSVIEEKLREDPNHAEALVWRGAARYWEAGQAFRAGNTAGFQVLASAAMVDMDRAIALQPSNIGVLIPRAATLLVAARNLRDSAQTQSLAALAAADFESALVIREPAFDRLGQHNRGEYLSGLAESWALAGNRDKAEGYLRRILAELPNSPYAERAAAKFANWSDRRPLNCQTCH
jgi:tetratricopeptide (TPR) repeat protein